MGKRSKSNAIGKAKTVRGRSKKQQTGSTFDREDLMRQSEGEERRRGVAEKVVEEELVV